MSLFKRSFSILNKLNISRQYKFTKKAYSIDIPKVEIAQLKFSDKKFGIVSQLALDGIGDTFDDFGECSFTKDDYDDGVLTVNLGGSLGTYVLNKQSPNQQIWLSSPLSGPKRFNFTGKNWVARDQDLHVLLSQEITRLLGNSCTFSNCKYPVIT